MQLLSKPISDILLGDTDITDITGTGNIWHAKIPQQTTSGSTEPQSISIYFYTYAVTPNDTKSGRSDLDTHMVRVHICGTDDHQMNQVARYVRLALDRIEPGNYSGIEVQGSRFLNSYYEPEGNYQLELQEWRLEFQFRVLDDIRNGGTMPNVTSGTYTPIGTNVLYADVITPYQAQYMRVGNTVTVSGEVGIHLDGQTEGIFRLSLPIDSTVPDTTDIAGTAVCTESGNNYAAQIQGGTTNKATFKINWGGGSPLVYSYTFTYQII